MSGQLPNTNSGIGTSLAQITKVEKQKDSRKKCKVTGGAKREGMTKPRNKNQVEKKQCSEKKECLVEPNSLRDGSVSDCERLEGDGREKEDKG